MRRARQVATLFALTLSSLALFLLVSPVAGAATVEQVGTGGSGVKPVALASTGLDIATPVIIGLSTLVAGILFVCWAFLRRGSTGQR